MGEPPPVTFAALASPLRVAVSPTIAAEERERRANLAVLAERHERLSRGGPKLRLNNCAHYGGKYR